jgi:membrane protein YdbS with pleckstrin-like domain
LQVIRQVCFNFAVIMLTKDEKRFVDYWETHRLRKKKVWRQLSVGLPLGAVMVVGIIANFLSGWYKKADMKIHADGSVVLVIVIAAILIVIFTTVFSAKHRWDMNEQRYREFLAKRDRDGD